MNIPPYIHIPDKKLPALQQVIHWLYTGEFSEQLLLQVAPSVCEIVEGHYLALVFFPNRFVKQHVIVSNNPPEFMPVYTSLIHKDFLMQYLVNTFQIPLLHELADWGFQQSDEFCVEVQRVRPISDVMYVPLQINGYLAGYWALGRAGLHSPFYSDNEVALFRFLSGFLTEGFRRSLFPPLLPEDVALLDAFGRVVQAGQRIRDVFTDLFGARCAGHPGAGLGKAHDLFRQRFTAFLTGFNVPREGEITLRGRLRSYTLFFSYLQAERFRIFLPHEPQVQVSLGQVNFLSGNASILDSNFLCSRYDLTSREMEILQGMYQGHTNKEIASSLKIGESTVKRHTSSIFEKLKVDSRCHLVLKLGAGVP